MPIIPACVKESAGKPGLQSKFPESQDYTTPPLTLCVCLNIFNFYLMLCDCVVLKIVWFIKTFSERYIHRNMFAGLNPI